MQFIDLAYQQSLIRDKIESNIKKVLDHGKYINGPEVTSLEDILRQYIGVKYAVGCSSGTDAILMPLMAAEIGPGDAVFTTTFTFVATAEVIQILGATPVFVDIKPDTYNIDTDHLSEVIKQTIAENKLKPKAIIPVDLFGQPADYDEINIIAKENNLLVIEDSAQGFGGEYKGKKACALAHSATTSFFPAKPFGCYGDGGMIFTDDEELYQKLLSIRVHGQGSDKYDNIRVGLNARLDTLQAAIMLAKFDLFPEELVKRQSVAKNYSESLIGKVQVPIVKDGNISAWAQYCVEHPKRDIIINHLRDKGIPTAIYYPKPLHLQTAFKHLGYKDGDFPVTEKAAKEIFALPMHPYLCQNDQEKIIKNIISVI